jgi:hypothetical protein
VRRPIHKAVVLCEGKEDRLVFEKVASLAGLEGLVFEDYGGKDNLGNFLQGLKVRPDYSRKEFATLALTRDADDSFENAWRSLANTAKQHLNTEMSAPGVSCEIPEPEYPQDNKIQLIGWVLPGPQQTGMLESLCLQSVASQPEFECLETYFKCLSEKLHMMDFHPKAKFHAWIVSQTDFKDKDYKIEKAIKENRFQWEHSAFDGLRQFLSKLV